MRIADEWQGRLHVLAALRARLLAAAVATVCMAHAIGATSSAAYSRSTCVGVLCVHALRHLNAPATCLGAEAPHRGAP